MLWVLVLGAILIWAPSPTITHRTSADRGHTQIKPKPCTVNGIEGTCMFVYECIKSDGRHIGMCVDNFMFGSCCSHNATQNTILPHHQSHPNVLYSQSNVNSSPRPWSLSINARPNSQSSSKLRPSKPITFVTRTTKRPPTTPKNEERPATPKPATVGKPWTNKPPHFVTSSRPSKYPSGTAPPAANHSSLVFGNATYTSVYDLIATSRPPHDSTTTKTSLLIVNDTKSSAMEPAETSAISWSTLKPTRPNEIATSSKPFPHSSKPEHWVSGKPYSRPSAAATEPIFVTRPRPSSNVHRTKPTRKPVLLITAATSSTSSTSATKTTTTTTTTTSTSTTSTTTSTTTTTTTTTTTPAPTTETAVPSTTPTSGASKYQYSGQCGVAALSPRPEMRIVGGKNAPFGGWPWQVSVRRTSFFGFSSTHRCGGAVINENWIATAGHCVDDLLTSQIRIRVGEYDFSSVMEPYPFVERAVSKKVVHPKYNFFTYEYDLALVRLDSPLEFQPHISPICLPASDDLLIGENATVTGWGRLSEGGTLPSVLQQVSVPIVSNDKCKSMFLRAGRHEFIPEIFLCAGYENGGQDSCQGDSGGPLQVKGKNGRYFLAGIISWGIGCAEANLPGVCTRISKFVPWILENVT